MNASQRWPSLKPAEWPTNDLKAWMDAIRAAGPLDKGGPASGYAPDTLQTMRELVGGLLWWIRHDGRRVPDDGPASWMTSELFGSYLEARRRSVSDNTVFNNVRMLALAFKAMEPEHDWSWMACHPMAPTRQDALAAKGPFRAVCLEPLLEGLVQRLELLRGQPITQSSAIRVRNLLIVTVTLCTVLRQRNISELSLGASIFRAPAGYEIRILASAMKNARQVTMRLRPELTPHLDNYVSVYRPLLHKGNCRQANTALWLGVQGGPMTSQHMESIFKSVVMEVLGAVASPHDLRRNAVTEMLRRDQAALEVAAALLGHEDTATTRDFYDHSDDAAAWSVWRELVAKYSPARPKSARAARNRKSGH